MTPSRLFTASLQFVMFAGFAAALSTAAATNTEQVFLSGHDRADAVPWEFRCSDGRQAGVWATIPVPSNWEMHGFGTLSYHRDQPADEGDYRRRFEAPTAWQGARVFLVFDGVMTDTTATLNGQPVGPTHRGGFYRFRYDVTSLLRLGAENTLEVHVAETSSDPSVNKAERTGDYWNFGGIFRPVWLQVVPAQFIERVAIDARADGGFAADVFTAGLGAEAEVSAQIFTVAGEPVGAPFTAGVRPGEKTRVTGRVTSPKLWSAETPALYEARFELRVGGQVTHAIRQQFGFRTFEVRRGQGFFLNGNRIVLQGADRHSFRADSGRCLAESDHRSDIELMREMNMNAVRMSHYPPDERFLELCDELGLYVLDELAGWQKSYSVEAGRPLVAEMVQRDVNHPCVLFWDNGNEGGWEQALDPEFGRWDPQQRVVLHPWDVHNGVNTAHYRVYDDMVVMAAGGFTGKRRDGKPVPEPGPYIYMPTEFLHGLYDGGAGAGMEDYWNVMRRSPLAGGGFVWALVDEGVKRPDTGHIDVHGNEAPDGILGPNREKEASFYTIKELWSPLIVAERDLPTDFSGTFSIENRYGFINAAQCRFTWELRRMPAPASNDAVTVVQRGDGALPNIAPGEKGKLQLSLPANWRDADVLALRLDDPAGHELWTSTWPLPGLARLRNLAGLRADPAAEPTVLESAQTFEIVVGDLSVELSRQTARLVGVRRAGRTISFTNGPRLATGDSKLGKLQWRRDGADVVASAKGDEALKQVEWRIRADGWVDCDYAYTASAPAPVLGVCFDYPERWVRSKKWVGQGPYRVWQNRRRGVAYGAWELPYNDTITGWSGWQYPEFKGCFAGVSWLALDTTEGRITTVVRTEDLFVQVLTPSFTSDELAARARVQLPTAGLSFLHVIPAMGNKFQTPETLGPQSKMPPVRPEYKGGVSFRFD